MGASAASHPCPLCFPDHHSEGGSHVGDRGAGQDHHRHLILAEPDPAGAAGRGAGHLPHQAGGEGAAGERGSTLILPHRCPCPRLGVAEQFCPHLWGQGEALGRSEQKGWKSARCPLALARSPETRQGVEAVLRERPSKLASHGPHIQMRPGGGSGFCRGPRPLAGGAAPDGHALSRHSRQQGPPRSHCPVLAVPTSLPTLAHSRPGRERRGSTRQLEGKCTGTWFFL